MRVGNAPISWGVCEIPDWGPQLPYERVLDEMAHAGYEGTELGPWGYMPDDPRVLGEALRARGLAMAASFVPVDLRAPGRLEEERESVRSVAVLLKALGARHILIADGGDPLRMSIAGRLEKTRAQGLTGEQWRYLAQSLEELARMCQDEYGLELCVHSHGGSYIENPDEIDRLMELTDPALVKLCLDTGHIAFGGGDPLQVARSFAERIGHVHLKDIRLDLLERFIAEGKDYVAAAKGDVFVALGQGDVDIPGIFDALRRAGYAGWIIVEQDRVLQEGEDSLAAPLFSRAYLRETIGI